MNIHSHRVGGCVSGPQVSSHYVWGVLLAGLLMLSACSGDGRAFEEAVEVQELDLASLRVIPPERTKEEAYFAVGQIVDFRVSGANTSGGNVELSGVDRQWRVSDSNVATIDSNGRLIGRSASNAPISVDLIIGGITSESFSFNVSDAPLQSILPIEGPESLDPCLPMEYMADGMFSDSTRPLYDVEWAVAPAESARVVGVEQGVVEINGVGPSDIQLSATSAGLTSEPRLITFQQTLNSISVTPADLGLQVGGSRDMVATGSYADGVTTTISGPPGSVPPAPDTETGTDDQETSAVAENSQVITDNVVWQISSGSDLATISNDADTRGRLDANDSGSVTVTASCGAVQGMETLSISERSSTSSNGGLSFVSDEINDLDQLILSLTSDRNGVRVRLEDSSGDDVTSQANWSASTTNTNSNDTSSTEVIRVGNTTSDKGLITPLREGSQDIRVVYDDVVATLTVEVIP